MTTTALGRSQLWMGLISAIREGLYKLKNGWNTLNILQNMNHIKVHNM